MNDSSIIDLTVLTTTQVHEVSVQEWWDTLVDEGIDPDEDHIALVDIESGEGKALVQEIARGNLMECIIAASKTDQFTHIMPLERYYEVSGGTN